MNIVMLQDIKLTYRNPLHSYTPTMRKQKDKLRKQFWKKLEIELPYDPEIPLLGIHTEETRIERDSCTPVFIAALFTTARTWKQPRCPVADQRIKKLWYIYKWNITQL